MTDLITEMRNDLISGYKEFRASEFHEQKELYEKLGTEGQEPKVMLISCADSRVDPTDIFHAYPGEMFVLRNVANLVPPAGVETPTPSTAAALEFAVTVLKVKCIVVMGHESCGGIQGCLAGLDEGFVGSWIKHLEPARDVVRARNVENEQFEMELEGVRLSLRNLMTFDFVRKAVESGELVLQGAYFSIISAKLLMMGDDGEFGEVAPS